MAINPTDWPIDPYTVDGVELANRLNAVIPSEFDSLNSGKANLNGGNTFGGNQTFGGASVRLRGDFSNATLASRAAFQSSVTNGNTSLFILPNGTSTATNVTVVNNSDPTNATGAQLAINGAVASINLSGFGTNSAASPVFQINQAGTPKIAITAEGFLEVRNTNAGSNGVFRQMAANGTLQRMSLVDASGNLIFYQTSSTAVVQFMNDGTANFHGALTFSFSAPGGGGRIYRTQDGSGIRAVNVEDPSVGTRAQLAYFPSVGASWCPGGDGQLYLGLGILRWAQIYSTSGVISTSDAREKSAVRQFNDNEIACAEELSDLIGFYQWLKDIDKDGAEARWQVGNTAQKLDEVFKKYHLNSQAYGIILFEEYEAMGEQLDDKGNVIRPATPAQDRWSANYAQLNQFMIAGLRSKQKKLEQRLAALEAK